MVGTTPNFTNSNSNNNNNIVKILKYQQERKIGLNERRNEENSDVFQESIFFQCLKSLILQVTFLFPLFIVC